MSKAGVGIVKHISNANNARIFGPLADFMNAAARPPNGTAYSLFIILCEKPKREQCEATRDDERNPAH